MGAIAPGAALQELPQVASGAPLSSAEPAVPLLLSNTTYFGGILLQGDRGEPVADLQRRLAELGYYSGPIDGFFGPSTEAAVFDFQIACGLTMIDGIVGPETGVALWNGCRGGGGGFFPPNGGGGGVATGTVRRGDSGPQVRQLQTLLDQVDFYDGPITGNFGPRTEEAVRLFQRSQGLLEDGVAGPSTFDALEFQAAERRRASAAGASSFPETGTLPPSTAFGGGDVPELAPLPSDNFSTAPLSTAGYEFSDRYSVMALQEDLRDRGFYFGPINGILDAETQRAIDEAQAAYGLGQDDLLRSGF
jgi:peptidoglycan hydrolase-like protein with peptidoglycan-binding domain